MREIILPTLKGMEKDGVPYTGFLYAGLMIDSQGQVKALEFNCRMGDPETQPILMRLKSDLLDVLLAATEPGAGEEFAQTELEWDRRIALGVVMAAGGYPLAPSKGAVISGLPKDTEEVVVFHAATTQLGSDLQVSGGRVLCVTALGDSVKQAQARVYQSLHGISFEGSQHRTDIGYRAIKA